MCFSATASFVAGGALSVAGGLTIAQVKKKSELLFASIPLLFGIQQAIEGAVWVSFGSSAVNTVATYTYSIFSHVLWPIFAPASILLLEKDPVRRRILQIFTGIGFAVGIYLFYFIFRDGVASQILNQSVAYNSSHLYFPFVLTLYVFTTCISFFISSNKIINIIGVVMIISFFIAGWFFSETFISVWCFFAAILSVLIYWYFKQKSIVARHDEKELTTA